MRRIARGLDLAVIALSILGGARVTLRTMEYGLVHRERAFLHGGPALPPAPRWAVAGLAHSKQIACAHTAESESPEEFPGIKKTAQYTYEVFRPELAKRDRAVGVRAARIVPEVRDGVTYGFLLFAVRPDGPFAALGLRNGDIVRGLNGISLTSPDSALQAYAKLKVASHLSITIDRAGCPVTIEVSLQ